MPCTMLYMNIHPQHALNPQRVKRIYHIRLNLYLQLTFSCAADKDNTIIYLSKHEPDKYKKDTIGRTCFLGQGAQKEKS